MPGWREEKERRLQQTVVLSKTAILCGLFFRGGVESNEVES